MKTLEREKREAKSETERERGGGKEGLGEERWMDGETGTETGTDWERPRDGGQGVQRHGQELRQHEASGHRDRDQESHCGRDSGTDRKTG